MKTLLLILVIGLLPCTSFAIEWDTTDTVLESISAGMTVIDWGQTRDIRNHDGVTELNPFLGRTPSRGSVDTYFGIMLVAHPVISYLLPKEYRTIWQCVYIGTEWTSISANYKGGLKLAF